MVSGDGVAERVSPASNPDYLMVNGGEAVSAD